MTEEGIAHEETIDFVDDRIRDCQRDGTETTVSELCGCYL